MGSVPLERLGIASGTNTIGRFLGRAAGVAVLGTLWAHRVQVKAGPEFNGVVTEAAPAAQIAALQSVSYAALVLIGVTLALIAWETLHSRTASRPVRASS